MIILINLVKQFCYIYKFIKYNLINNFNYNHGDKHFNKKNNNNLISSNYMKILMLYQFVKINIQNIN